MIDYKFLWRVTKQPITSPDIGIEGTLGGFFNVGDAIAWGTAKAKELRNQRGERYYLVSVTEIVLLTR